MQTRARYLIVFGVAIGLWVPGVARAYDTIAPGDTLSGTTGGAAQTTACCDAPLYNHPEKVYQFTTPATGGTVATVRVTGGQTTNTTPAKTFYPTVYIASTPTGAPFGCEQSNIITALAELRTQLVPSTTYYIVVDGSSLMNSYGQAVTGNFTIQLLYGATYGSARVVPNGTNVSNVVKMRYRFAVTSNNTTATACQGQTWKIAFMPQRLVGPSGSMTEFQGGAPQTNIYNSRRVYSNGSTSHVCYPPSTPNFTEPQSESSMWFSAEDFNPSGRVGSKTQDQTYFPNYTQLVDGFTGEWKHEYISQQNLNSLRGTVTVERIGTTTDTTGLSCNVQALTPDTRWIWRHTLRSHDTLALALHDQTSHSVDFMLPSGTGKYLDPTQMTSIFSEAFYVHRGLERIYYWGFEVQQENSSTWIPISQWKLDYTDATASTPNLYNWGYRAATYAGHNAVELSNDAVSTYITLNQTVSTATVSGCSEAICVSTGTNTCSITTSTALTPDCELDLGDQEVTIPAGVTVSSTGSFTIVGKKVIVNGTAKSTGGGTSTLVLGTLVNRVEVAGLVENKGGSIVISSANGILHTGTMDAATGGQIYWFPGVGKDVGLYGDVYANGGLFSIGVGYGFEQACGIYINATAYANFTAVSYAGTFNEGASGTGFNTSTATVYCRCSNPPTCNVCADAPASGAFFNGSGPITPTFSYQPYPTCTGGCS